MTTATFDTVTQQIKPLVEQSLRDHEPQPLRDLTVQVIWTNRTQRNEAGSGPVLAPALVLTPALVDIVLRQLDRLGVIKIADDGQVSWVNPR